MLVCFVWMQLMPAPERVGGSRKQARDAGGPIRLVVIDAGHGGQDTGAIRGGVLEKDMTLDVARRLEREVQAAGLATMLTRSGDKTVSLAERAAAANRERDCVFVSIHFDEGGRAAATGVNTYYAARQTQPTPFVASWLPFLQPVATEQPPNVESQSLAGFVQQAMVARTQAVDRGVRTQQFYVIANVRHPAVLVEGGFLSNAEDISRITTEEYRQQLAVAIHEGIMRYRQVLRERDTVLASAKPST
jgi:N-acetylmuramoyl-L-alanine amidase